VTDDYKNNPRDPITPDIGHLEYSPCHVDLATSPNPLNGGYLIGLTGSTLMWTNGAGTTDVEIYFGPSPGALTQYYDGPIISSYAISLTGQEPLTHLADYQWEIICKDTGPTGCSAASDRWNFTAICVGTASNPTPVNGAINVGVTGNSLMWTNGASTTNVEVWFGPVGNMIQLYDGPVISTYSLAGVEPLSFLGFYEWQIICKNGSCPDSFAEVWSFRAQDDPSLVVLFQDNFEAGLGNWTIINDGGTCVWQIFTPPYPNTYTLPVASSGGVLAADADDCGTTILTTAKITSPIDATSYTYVRVDFANDFRHLDAADECYVEVSLNDSTWTTVLSFIGASQRNTEEFVDISAQVAGSMFYLRFRSVQPGFDWWWVIDNVQVKAN
jgi:hypothetical protein